LIEAKNNVLNLIYNQLISKNYYSSLELFREELYKKINNELTPVKIFEPDTIKTITEEMWKIFSANFAKKIFFPANYYSLIFRTSDPKRKSEQDFIYIVDSFLIQDDGSLWNVPIETYAITLSQESRQKQFELITGGFENPLYTLKDYLFIYS
jgi:hypothetical protein